MAAPVKPYTFGIKRPEYVFWGNDNDNSDDPDSKRMFTNRKMEMATDQVTYVTRFSLSLSR